MLIDRESADAQITYSIWKPNRVVVFSLATAVLSASVGMLLGVAFGISSGLGGLVGAAFMGSMFGGFVGLIAALLFASVGKIKAIGTTSVMHTTSVFAAMAAIPGVLVLSIFSEGVKMMLFQAGFGALLGGVIGGISGTVLGVIWKRQARTL